TVVLELDHGGGRHLAHVLDRVLVTEPVGTLDRVVHVPAPIVLAHVAERRADAALRRHRVAAGGEHLGHAGRRQALLREAQGRPQPRAAGADDDDVVAVIDELVVFAHCAGPNAIRNTANTAAIASAACPNVDRINAPSFNALAWR